MAKKSVKEQNVTSTVELDGFPTPSDLMSVLDKETDSLLEKICREIPWSFAGNRGIRYYQERAVEGVIKSLGTGKKNALAELSFPGLDHALTYFSDIQHWLYAA